MGQRAPLPDAEHDWLSGYIRNHNRVRRLATAFRSSSFPVNPIPFAVGLAEYVRENGSDAIKHPEARAMLLILIMQAHGQLARVDCMAEYSELDDLLQ